MKHPLVNKVVHVHWREDDNDWNLFKVLYVNYPLVRMQGIPDKGIPYRSGPIWVDFSQIDCIEEIEETEDGS